MVVDHLGGISVEELQDALDNVDGKKPTQWLYLEETYGVEYSIPSCRRLLKEARLSYQKPRRSAAEADEDEQEAFHHELKKSGGRWTPPYLY